MIEPESAPLQRPPWGVAALLLATGDALAARFGAVAVRGELSGLTRATSGHWYFSLKDADGAPALLRCAMFRRAAVLVDFVPADGQQVELRGRLGVYEPRGELQMVVESLQRLGAGTLYEEFLRRRARLEAQGLFDTARKRPLPAFPATIGVVTSLGAAALRDVLTTLQRRAPQVRVVVYPSPVQGAEAPVALATALQRAGQRREVDVLLLVRGGGALEDLWAFNDERVVRAVAGSALPVVCGVGHETDVTLADFAADLRAPTPTAAAELAAPAREGCLAALAHQGDLMRQRMHRRLDREAQRLDHAALRLARPGDALHRQRQRLALLAQRHAQALPVALRAQADALQRLEARLGAATLAQRSAQAQRLALLAARLQSLDPQQVLARGYAWLSDDSGRALTSVRQVAVGATVQARLRDGRVQARVTDVAPQVDA